MAGVVLSLKQLVSRSNCFVLPLRRHRNRSRHLSTKGETNASSNPSGEIEISDSCVERLRQIGENTSLRVAVEGGGCSGFQYTFELDSRIEEGDRVFKKGGATIIVDESSLQYIKGATVEYHTELIRSAFRIVKNPLAEQGCSCGASFNIKIPN